MGFHGRGAGSCSRRSTPRARNAGEAKTSCYSASRNSAAETVPKRRRMTIVGRRVLARYVRDLFNAPLAFPRGGKFVGAFATFSSMLGFSVQRRKEMLPTPTHFLFSGTYGTVRRVLFPRMFSVFSRIFQRFCRERSPVEPRSEAIPGKCGCCKRCQSTEI